MTKHVIMLNALYETGNKIAPILCWVFILLMLVAITYVFVKYVITSDK